MERLYLVVGIAGERVALPAEGIESVVEIEQITPVPLAAPHVAGLAALRSRVLAIVDSLASLEQGRSDLSVLDAAHPREAVVVPVEGHLYGLLVDEVEDVVEIADAIDHTPLHLPAGWHRVVIGTIEVDDDTLLLVNPAALVAGPPALAA